MVEVPVEGKRWKPVGKVRVYKDDLPDFKKMYELFKPVSLPEVPRTPEEVDTIAERVDSTLRNAVRVVGR